MTAPSAISAEGRQRLLPPDELCFELRKALDMVDAPTGRRDDDLPPVSYPSATPRAAAAPADEPDGASGLSEGQDPAEWLAAGGLEALRATVDKQRTARDARRELEPEPTFRQSAPVVHVRTDPVKAALIAERQRNPGVARDCWLLAGDPEGALACQAPATPGRKMGLQSSARLALTLTLGAPLDVGDLLSVVNPKLTSVATRYPRELLRAMETTLLAEQAAGRDLRSEILNARGLEWHGWLIMNATPLAQYVGSAPMPALFDAPGLKELLGPIHRQAENALREDIGLPRVGESWVSETELFIGIRNALAGITPVEQHGSPAGFGRQHLDVWLPEWRVGVEYQGLQHDEPVEIFGGVEGWEATQKRDRVKRQKCAKLGIHLIEVRPGYVLDDVLIDIRARSPAQT